MWTYVQQTGEMIDPTGKLLAVGYAGNGAGKNNPAMQDVHGVGPLPCGFYRIEKAVDTVDHGPEVMWLVPDPANEMFGRGGFGLHGDSKANPGCASKGCPCLPRAARDTINASMDRKLQVVASLPNDHDEVNEAATAEN